MLCGFREVSRFVKTARIHFKQATYLHCTVEIGHFALYPVRLKSISDPFKNIRNETIYQCDVVFAIFEELTLFGDGGLSDILWPLKPKTKVKNIFEGSLK